MRRKILIVALASVAPVAASAQSAPPPFGTWRGEAAGDTIYVAPDGGCAARGSVNLAGNCGWNPTATGGVLTMSYQWATGPANMYWNVTWIDENTILVNSVERFHRVG